MALFLPVDIAVEGRRKQAVKSKTGKSFLVVSLFSLYFVIVIFHLKDKCCSNFLKYLFKWKGGMCVTIV